MFRFGKVGTDYTPSVSIDDLDVQLRSIFLRGSTWYVKVSKRGSSITHEQSIGTKQYGGAKRGTVLGSVYHVEWQK